jgi:hypothetical protein
MLRVLTEHDVDFIVVGGVSAVLNGAPTVTFDLDVVHARTPENVARLLAALRELDAVSRLHLPRRLVPDATHLSSPGHQLLATNAGPLDVLGEIGGRRGYDDLLTSTLEVELPNGRRVRILTLEALIETKQASGRPKDLAVLPLLRATLEERRRGR